MSFASSFSGVRLEGVSRTQPCMTRATVRCVASQDDTSRRQLLGAGLTLAATVLSPAVAQADIVSELLAKTEANKALNDRKRLVTSYANFARSRTLADGTCQFPNNFFGCDIQAVSGKVKYIADDIDLECEGNEAGTCAEKPDMLGIVP